MPTAASKTGRPAKEATPVERVRWARGKAEVYLSGNMKATVGEYLRLLEAEREWDAETTQEVRVAWAEPEADTSSDE